MWSHYDREVQKYFKDGKPRITILYRCRHGHPEHTTVHRCDRSKHSQGTTNLRDAAIRCDKRRLNGKTSLVPATPGEVPVRSEAMLHVLTAVLCAARKRSFQSVTDKEFVRLLQHVSGNPTLCTPSEHTVQRDVERLYEGMAPLVTAYFKVL